MPARECFVLLRNHSVVESQRVISAFFRVAKKDDSQCARVFFGHGFIVRRIEPVAPRGAGLKIYFCHIPFGCDLFTVDGK